MLLSCNQLPEDIDSGQIKTKQNLTLLLEEVQKATLDLQSFLSHSDSRQENTKEYYQNIWQGGQALRTLAQESELKIDEMEKDLQSLMKQCKLFFQLQCNQQKFYADPTRRMMERIHDSLAKIDRDLNEIERNLNLIKFDSDPMELLSKNLSEETLSKFLQQSQTEMKTNHLVQIYRELHNKELKLRESNNKTQELYESIVKSRERIEKIERIVHEKEASYLQYIEKTEQLKLNSIEDYDSKLSDLNFKYEKQKEKVFKVHEKKMNEIDELIRNLSLKLSQDAAMNPSIHFLLLLDQSRSMKGSRWSTLLKAVEIFVKQNQNQASDLLSVITFDNTATEVMKKIKFSDYQAPSASKWGDTNFDSAFMLAKDILSLPKTHRPVVLFLTDGRGRVDENFEILREMSTSYKDRGLMFFSVGVGDDYEVETVQNITRIANDGKLFVDLGNERIEFQQSARDEKVLEHVCKNLSNALTSSPLRIKTAIEVLRKERKEFDEETRREYELYTSIHEQEFQACKKSQEDLLEKRIKVLEEKREEEKSQIESFNKEKEDLKKEIEVLEAKLKAVPQLVIPAEIEILFEKKNDVKKERDQALFEKEKFWADQDLMEDDLQKSKRCRNLSTSLQLFDFFKAKERAAFLKCELQTYIRKIINFIKPIIRETSYIGENLNSIIHFGCSDLEEENFFDIVLESYKNIVPLEKNQDIINFKRIACHILEIHGGNEASLEVLEFIITCFSPRTFVSPKISDKERKCIIKSFIEDEDRFNIALFDSESDRINDEWRKITEKLEFEQRNLREMKAETRDLEEEKLMKERKVKALKTRMSKQKKDETEKERVRNNNNAENEESDEDHEEMLETILQKLEEIEKKIREKKSKKKPFKERIQSLQINIENLQHRRFEMKVKRLEKESEKEKIKNTILNYCSRLRAEFMARVDEYVREIKSHRIEAYERDLMENVVTPINNYFS